MLANFYLIYTSKSIYKIQSNIYYRIKLQVGQALTWRTFRGSYYGGSKGTTVPLVILVGNFCTNI